MKNYRKNYFCICEGQQEIMYLEHLARLLKRFPQRVIDFHPTEGDVLTLRKNYTEYDHAALFDYDFEGEHFRKSIEKCDKVARDLAKRGRKRETIQFCHAYSNVNFDLWLLLHKQDYRKSVGTNDAYKGDIRLVFALEKSADIKQKKVIERILSQTTLDEVKEAISRADKIKEAKLQEDAKRIGDSIVYDNPDLSIHEFVRNVLKDCGEL